MASPSQGPSEPSPKYEVARVDVRRLAWSSLVLKDGGARCRLGNLRRAPAVRGVLQRRGSSNHAAVHPLYGLRRGFANTRYGSCTQARAC